MVVKESYFNRHWENDPHEWISASFTENQKVLREPAMHMLLGGENSPRSIVKFRGRRIYENYLISRIYMEYCPHGDLDQVYTEHAKHSMIHGDTLDENDQPMQLIRIPPRALWSFCEDLAEAASFMEHGHDPLDPTSPLREDWQTVIHRDLKLYNIFLGLPRTPGKRGIPELKVGDFGLAIPHDYEENPGKMVGFGTDAWKAPEQTDNALKHKLSSATNVWAMGRIVLALVELSAPRPAPVLYGEFHQGRVQHAPGKMNVKDSTAKSSTGLSRAV